MYNLREARAQKQARARAMKTAVKGDRNYDTFMVQFYDQACIKRQRKERIITTVFYGFIIFVSLFSVLAVLFMVLAVFGIIT